MTKEMVKMDQHLYDRIAEAYSSVSASSVRTRLQALRAEKIGRHDTAVLLHAIAFGEEIHARRLLMALRGKIQDTDVYMEELVKMKRENSSVFGQLQNEAEAAGWPVHREMFDRLIRVSRHQGSRLKKHLASEEKVRETYFVCRSCGYIATGTIPEKCPVCNAVPGRFTKDIFGG